MLATLNIVEQCPRTVSNIFSKSALTVPFAFVTSLPIRMYLVLVSFVSQWRNLNPSVPFIVVSMNADNKNLQPDLDPNQNSFPRFVYCAQASLQDALCCARSTRIPRPAIIHYYRKKKIPFLSLVSGSFYSSSSAPNARGSGVKIQCTQRSKGRTFNILSCRSRVSVKGHS